MSAANEIIVITSEEESGTISSPQMHGGEGALNQSLHLMEENIDTIDRYICDLLGGFRVRVLLKTNARKESLFSIIIICFFVLKPVSSILIYIRLEKLSSARLSKNIVLLYTRKFKIISIHVCLKSCFIRHGLTLVVQL